LIGLDKPPQGHGKINWEEKMSQKLLKKLKEYIPNPVCPSCKSKVFKTKISYQIVIDLENNKVKGNGQSSVSLPIRCNDCGFNLDV